MELWLCQGPFDFLLSVSQALTPAIDVLSARQYCTLVINTISCYPEEQPFLGPNNNCDCQHKAAITSTLADHRASNHCDSFTHIVKLQKEAIWCTCTSPGAAGLHAFHAGLMVSRQFCLVVRS